MIAAVVVTFLDVAKIRNNELLIINLKTAFHQMSVLEDEYLFRHEDRAKVQWDSKVKYINNLLDDSGNIPCSSEAV
jgi:hypothetical protein